MTATQNPAQPQPSKPTPDAPGKWKVLSAVIFGVFMVILDTTVVNVAYPELRRAFHATVAESQWVISLYVLAIGVTTPMAGYLADRFGIKNVYVAGLAVFATGSLLSGMAPTLPILIAARALQGIGGGMATPLGSAMLYAAFPPEEQGMALGVFGVALVVAPAIGPILGGVLVDHGLWRWIFLINVPIGALGVTLGTRFLRNWPRHHRPQLDLLGLPLAIVGFGAPLYAASQAADRGWAAPGVLVAFAIGGAALAGFALVELFVAKEPLLDLRLYGRRVFLLASVLGYVSVIALFGAEFLLPLYLQLLRGRGGLATGLTLLPLAVSAGVMMPLAGRIYDRIGPRALLVLGYSILAFNTWQLSKLTATTSLGWIAFLMVARGTALGLTVQTTFASALSVVPRNRLPRGTSLINATRNVTQAIGVAMLASILAGAISPATRAAQSRLQGGSLSTAPVALCAAGSAAGASDASSGAVAASLSRACTENLTGFERAYRVTFFAALVALAIGAFMPGWPFGWEGRAALARTAG